MKAFLGAVSTAVLAFTVACSQSDAGITTAVKSKLAADTQVKAYKVDVDTKDKVVTLSGDVETPAQRDHALMIARSTTGVTAVIDQLRVNPTAATSGVDVDIEVDDKLEADLKKGADKTKEGAKKAGEAIKDVFTDDDRDSDKDGK